jgi:cytochrome c oxidase subunit IV
MKPLPWWTFPLVAGTVVWCGVLLPYWLDGQGPLRTWMLPWLPVAVLAPVAGFHAFQASAPVRLRVAGALLAAVVAAAVLSSRVDSPGILTVQAVVLGTVHLPVFLAGTALWAYLQSAGKEDGVDAVRHALSVAALTAGLLAIGGVLIALTVGLLYVVDATEGQIETTLIHVATWGLTSSVFFGHALWLRFPGVFDRILPAVARLFFPVLFALEAAFLVALGIQGLDELSTDRDRLFAFNALLLAVVGLLVAAASFTGSPGNRGRWLGVGMAGCALVANLLALYAISYRLGEWGFSLNRVAVLSSNVLLCVALGAFVFAEVRSADGSAARRTLNRLLAGVWLWSAVWAVGVGVGVENENEVEVEVEDEVEVEVEVEDEVEVEVENEVEIFVKSM